MTTRGSNSNKNLGLFNGFFEDCRSAPSKTSIKIVLIGDGSTGKTSYFNCLAHSDNPDYRFNKIYDATRGCNVCQMEFTFGRYSVTVHLFDTAGQEKFGMLRDSYIMGADGIILMYDLAVSATKQSVLTKWLPEVKKILKNTGERSRVPVAVIGNKSDKLDPLMMDVDQQHKHDVYDRPGIRTSTLVGAYEPHKFGQIEHFNMSIKADENVMEPINWLLKHILSYIIPIDAKRVKGSANVMMCNQ